MFGLFCPYEYAPRGCSILFPDGAVNWNCFGFGDNNIATVRPDSGDRNPVPAKVIFIFGAT